MDKAKRVLLALGAPRQEDIWHAALLSQECEVESIPRGVSLASFGAGRAPRSRPADLLLVDLSELAAEALTLGRFAEEVAAAQPWLKLAATLAERFEVAAAERRWARRQGAIDLFPRLSAAALMRERSPALTTVLGELRLPVDGAKLAQALRAIGANAEDGVAADPAALAALGVDLEDLAEEMRGPEGVECRMRRYRLRAYPDCFVGSEAVAWIARACDVSREIALQAGQELLARGVFYHVVKEQPFRDGHVLLSVRAAIACAGFDRSGPAHCAHALAGRRPDPRPDVSQEAICAMLRRLRGGAVVHARLRAHARGCDESRPAAHGSRSDPPRGR